MSLHFYLFLFQASSPNSHRNSNTRAASGFPSTQNIEPLQPIMSTIFDQQTQQNILTDYIEEEQKDINNAWEEIRTKHEKNFNNLMDSLRQNSDISEVEHEFPLGQPLPQMNQETSSSDNLESTRILDMENQDMLTRLIQNDPNIQQQIGFEQFNENPTVGHIFRVPRRHPYESYRRRTRRSLDSTQLSNLLLKEKEIIDTLKKYADHDQDLMMIGYIGDSMVDDLKQKLTRRKHRMKRQLNGKETLPWTR